MLVQSIPLNKNNTLIEAYRQGEADILNYFDYKPFSSYKARYEAIKEQTYEREQLVSVLTKMNEAWGAPTSTMKQIERLKDENSVVVIGGQQAGLVSGPLYSLNKVISIIRLAKEQEAALKVPVIPVFWIAGEDHDYDEINHMFTLRDEKLHKHTTKQQQVIKKSVSHIALDKELTKEWLLTSFQDLQETVHTKDLYNRLTNCLEKATTFVDFFARVIFELFQEEGLVLIDAANEEVRALESDYFKNIIEQERPIAESVYTSIQRLQQEGYTIPLEVEEADAHLFYHDAQNERVLLKRFANDFVGKNDEVQLTKEQLLNIATETPEKLSNNVVTRPLMQELLFPTLAFVAGDGEISYWAALKGAFHAVGQKMPPVVPRLSFTYVTERLEKLLTQRVVSLEAAINQGTNAVKMNWLMAQETPPVTSLFEEAERQLEMLHAPLQELVSDIAPNMQSESTRNLNYMKENLVYLQRRIEQSLEEKYAIPMQQFTEIELFLHPNGVLQERVYTPLYFLNEYGFAWIEKLNQLEELSFEEEHYAVYLS